MGFEFLAIENQASIFGDKSKNRGDKPEEKYNKREKIKRDQENKNKYDARKAAAEAAGVKYYQDDSMRNIYQIATTLASRRTSLRVGVSGSLPSMMKRVQMCVENGSGKCSTLIFYGHGNAGIMDVGKGNIDTQSFDELSSKRGKNKDHIAAYEGMNMGKRSINVKNEDVWAKIFEEYKDCFAAERDSDIFYIFFLGCSTGNFGEISGRNITKMASEKLHNIFGCTVVAVGTDNEIDNQVFENIVGNIATIKMSTLQGNSGTIPIPDTAEVGLEWYKTT